MGKLLQCVREWNTAGCAHIKLERKQCHLEITFPRNYIGDLILYALSLSRPINTLIETLESVIARIHPTSIWTVQNGVTRCVFLSLYSKWTLSASDGLSYTTHASTRMCIPINPLIRREWLQPYKHKYLTATSLLCIPCRQEFVMKENFFSQRQAGVSGFVGEPYT